MIWFTLGSTFKRFLCPGLYHHHNTTATTTAMTTFWSCPPLYPWALPVYDAMSRRRCRGACGATVARATMTMATCPGHTTATVRWRTTMSTCPRSCHHHHETMTTTCPVLQFTFFFAFLISICPTLLANAFPSHDDYYSLPLLSRWSSWLRTLIFYSASFRRTTSFPLFR